MRENVPRWFWGVICNSLLLKTFEITQNFPLLLHLPTEWWWEWGFPGFITAFRGKCSVNNVSFTPPCYWAQPLCPSPSRPALCLCPGLAVQLCCLLLPFFSLLSCSVLSHSHPHAFFSPSAFSSFSSLSLCHKGKCWMHGMGSFSAVRVCLWCHWGIWLAPEIIAGKTGVQFLEQKQQVNWSLRKFRDIKCQRRELQVSVERNLY